MLHVLSRDLLILFVRIFFRLRVHTGGKRLKAPFIVVSNHASLLDPPIMASAVKPLIIDFMAKKELFDSRIFGGWTRRVRCIKVDRDSSGAGSLKEALRRLKNGHVVGLFPEGTRAVEGDIRPAKKGIGFLVAKAKVPVVPLYIKGSGEAFRHGKMNIGTRIDAYLGYPVSFEELAQEMDEKDPYGSISSAVTKRIQKLKDTAI